MLYERRVVDQEKGIIQITTEDERWYFFQEKEEEFYIPSETWICGYYPKGIAYHKWLASKGWDEAEALKEAAGEKGTYTHKGISMLLDSKTVRFNTIVEDRELTTEEYYNLMTFTKWYKKTKPRTIANEKTVFAEDRRHAGTVDFICEINKEVWIVDFKTSQNVWPSHILQLTGYCMALGIPARLGILQIGYKRNKDGFKFTEVPFSPDLWEATYKIWQYEVGNVKPLQRDYPLELSLKEVE